MYVKYFGLTEEPFGVTPDPRFLYLSRGHREAQATLEYGMRTARGFTALVAKPGMGKTSLLFRLLEQHSTKARTAFLFQTQCDSREFMRYLLAELGLDVRNADFVRLQDEFNHLLVRECNTGRQVIVVVDEAQNLTHEVLETVRLLSDFETPRSKLLHIILAGQPELADKLASPVLLQLRQRISHLIRLEPFSLREVDEYIQHRLRTAGYRGEPLFTRDALKLIWQRSEGVPRTINNLCFNALSLAFAIQKKVVDVTLMQEVSADLDFEAATRELRNDSKASERPEWSLQTEGLESPEVNSGSTAEADKPAVQPSPREAKVEETPVAKKSPEPFQPPAAAKEELPPKPASTSQPKKEIQPARKANGRSLAQVPEPIFTSGKNESSEPKTAESWMTPSVSPSPGQQLCPAETLHSRSAPTAEPKAAPGPESRPVPILDFKSAPTVPQASRVNGNSTSRVEEDNSAVQADRQTDQKKGDQPRRANEAEQAEDRPNGKLTIDVHALARDVALLGMQAPKRWSPPARPALQTPPTPAPKPEVRQSPVKAPAKPEASSPITPVQPVVKPPAIRNVSPPARSASMLRGYLTAAAFLLALVLVWLIARSPRAAVPGPENTIMGSGAGFRGLKNGEASEDGAPAVSAQVDNAKPLAGVAGSEDPPATSELDVVDQVPTLASNANAGTSDSTPTQPSGRRRTRGSQGLEQLVVRVDPIYPPAAKLGRIQGSVVINANIATDGSVRHIRVLSGQPLLAQAAVDAVKGWRYRPHIVRGKPIETTTQIVLNFKLMANPRISSASR